MTSTGGHAPHTRALISLQAFRHNLQAVRAYVGKNVEILAVVKANAYGHGAVRLAAEAQAEGARYLGVARIGEGIELRDAGIEGPIVVFEVAPTGLEEEALGNDLELTVSSLEGAERISRAAAKAGVTARVHVKVDTGMARLGIDFQSAASVIARVAQLPRIAIAGVYTHFATSEGSDTEFAREQLTRYWRVLDELERQQINPGLRHMANSGAIIAIPDSHFDMVRPGIMLYGYPPAHPMAQQHPLMPVMSLVSHVALLRKVPADTSVSYGRRYLTKAETTIATIPVGYADGYSRLLTGKADLLIGGHRFPVVGTICMDHIMADLGPDPAIREGEEVVLIGRSGNETIDSWVIADSLGTIPYEVTCQISGRVPRVFVD